MRISDWSSDVCSSDLRRALFHRDDADNDGFWRHHDDGSPRAAARRRHHAGRGGAVLPSRAGDLPASEGALQLPRLRASARSEEHTSELQSLMRISYAVFCLKKKINVQTNYS